MFYRVEILTPRRLLLTILSCDSYSCSTVHKVSPSIKSFHIFHACLTDRTSREVSRRTATHTHARLLHDRFPETNCVS